MSQSISIKTKTLFLAGIVSSSLMITGNAQAHSDRDYLGLAAPVILYSLLNNQHHGHRHYRTSRYKHYDHYPPRRHSHSHDRYKRGKGHGYNDQRGYSRGGGRNHHNSRH